MLNRRALLTAPGLAFLSGCKRAPRVKVGGKENIEGSLLAEIMSQLLERKLTAQIERRMGIKGANAVYAALQGSDVDVYLEYSRIAFQVLLKSIEPIDLTMRLEKLQKDFRTNAQAEWLGFLGFENIHTAVVRADDPAFEKINTLSQAGADRTGWKLGCTSEFAQSSEGYQVLKTTYQIPERTGTRLEPINQLYFGLGDKRIDMLITGSTDPRIPNQKYKVLVDDRGIFTSNQAGLLLRQEVAATNPQVREVLDSLNGKIDNTTMKNLNREIEINKRGLAEVAIEWLTSAKLI
ncbi:glycine betaine ABC transporter substrate-binding protein [Bryobacter aggregatus]|uniref:ABC transporter substrate-binding protein n=1 Tax=Bryobacter aggregatus TaxID=360054 RepID=UPI0004E132E0|nr:glycine betaine ABC transporter substrate-binding protein [Bryobacter aggregatus]